MSIRLCSVADVPEGSLLRVVKDELPAALVVARVGEEIFCLDDACSHMAASLAAGYIEKCSVVCPKHQVHFDLKTGQPDGLPARLPVKTHRIEIKDDAVFVVQ